MPVKFYYPRARSAINNFLMYFCGGHVKCPLMFSFTIQHIILMERIQKTDLYVPTVNVWLFFLCDNISFTCTIFLSVFICHNI